MKCKPCMLHKIAFLLVFVGAINWGLVGAFEFNLVDYLLGAWPIVMRVVYVLVGVSGLLMPFCGKCSACKMEK
ncbi:MAG: hypothetical protein ACD_28C00005G0002 [uncultured bacterium]|nr:MAG: hypothetical protein ACD_28C00005G0002 [uncultured bacterium]KKT75686.1 MAG: hypothetical protein UW70_C0030G0005 [Candidatus Peregrinibacteria bacterium GW2011_GWA2_44_7]